MPPCCGGVSPSSLVEVYVVAFGYWTCSFSFDDGAVSYSAVESVVNTNVQYSSGQPLDEVSAGIPPTSSPSVWPVGPDWFSLVRGVVATSLALGSDRLQPAGDFR